ncbi:uncharacterized protein VTP21DRAFT_11068 [Calcarisporiella thermophila]|uniref:uncharacterized protein n=1 Tax=Calcarisporiella thermophila TaxID=911321 RepID=UPI0037445ADF
MNTSKLLLWNNLSDLNTFIQQEGISDTDAALLEFACGISLYEKEEYVVAINFLEHAGNLPGFTSNYFFTDVELDSLRRLILEKYRLATSIGAAISQQQDLPSITASSVPPILQSIAVYLEYYGVLDTPVLGRMIAFCLDAMEWDALQKYLLATIQACSEEVHSSQKLLCEAATPLLLFLQTLRQFSIDISAVENTDVLDILLNTNLGSLVQLREWVYQMISAIESDGNESAAQKPFIRAILSVKNWNIRLLFGSLIAGALCTSQQSEALKINLERIGPFCALTCNSSSALTFQDKRVHHLVSVVEQTAGVKTLTEESVPFLIDTLVLLFLEQSRANPTDLAIKLNLMDLYVANGDYKFALKFFLEAACLSSDYFSDGKVLTMFCKPELVLRAVYCLTKLQEYIGALALYQLLPTTDVESAKTIAETSIEEKTIEHSSFLDLIWEEWIINILKMSCQAKQYPIEALSSRLQKRRIPPEHDPNNITTSIELKRQLILRVLQFIK